MHIKQAASHAVVNYVHHINIPEKRNTRIMVRHPKKVDFSHLYTNLELHLSGIKDYEKSLSIELDELLLKNEQTKEGLQELAALKVVIAETQVEIDSKQRLLDEYKARLYSETRDNKLEKKEVREKFADVYNKAYGYKKDFRLPKQIREHLNEMLNFDFKKLNEEQMVTYYLMLKSEIKMIENYKTRKK